MTIKEVEERLNMPRANIRYYEQEGLISPARAENGYREYSEEDVRMLERVQLLRALHCTVSEIRELKEGRATLAQVLKHKEDEFVKAEESATNAREICRAICNSQAQFETLDAKKYLSGAWRTQQPVRIIEAPKEELVRISPWRRFFARMLDWALYVGIWKAAAAFLWPAGTAAILDIVFGDILMLLFEPLLLHFWGTTPGKWILGLQVQAIGGGKLTVEQARERTWGVLVYGCMLCIPIAEFVGMWMCLRNVNSGEQLKWEYDSCVVQRDARTWRIYAYIALRVLIALALVCCTGLGRMPMHRGALSPKEFAENYNDLLRKYGIESYEMHADGTWQKPSEGPDGVVVTVIGEPAEDEQPELKMDVQDGIVRGLRMNMHFAGKEYSIGRLPVTQMCNAAMALCTADSPWYREMWMVGSDAERIARKIEDNSDAPWPWRLQLDERWQITYDVQYKGMQFTPNSDGLIIAEDDESFFTLTFEITSLQ